MRSTSAALAGCVLLLGTLASATIFGTVQGLIHDPQHRPVQGAQVTVRAVSSNWSKSTQSDGGGEFRFDAVPVGEYNVTVEVPGFGTHDQKVLLSSGRDARLHFAMTVAKT